ncbi:LysE family translocator [Solihabitans fulvus]|uniref:LysE family translocator n=1 Tax=Solihabitans fulvus TaxID=1892852 RepID=A0A5B2WNG9_9PSEU|nr:LysE family translocator [Solihabitans fulvus]KAA2252534.1 LysE family translocator [Solihabitans fulvus]
MITAAFLLSSLAVIMTPGPDLALITQLVVRYRRRGPALVAATGMISAGAVQALLGFVGLAVLLRTNPGLFAALRWVGAAALLVWGLLAFRAALRPAAHDPAEAVVPSRRAFLQGFLCTGSNPKVGLFLMAFLPQFVPRSAAPAPAMALLGVVYLSMGFLWLLTWINLVHPLRHRMFAPTFVRIADALVGAVFVTFAVRLALGW